MNIYYEDIKIKFLLKFNNEFFYFIYVTLNSI